jgi:predicted cobalt transporter CbtA
MENGMQTVEGRAGGAISVRIWRELGQLALECLAIGVVFSMLLVAAVYMVARNSHADDFAAAPTPAAEIATLVSN